MNLKIYHQTKLKTKSECATNFPLRQPTEKILHVMVSYHPAAQTYSDESGMAKFDPEQNNRRIYNIG